MSVGKPHLIATSSFLIAWTLFSATAIANEWWHGAFNPTAFTPALDALELYDCGRASDGLMIYTPDRVFPHETLCKITEKVPLDNMQAIWIRYDCTYPDDPKEEGYEKSELLILDGNGPHILRYPPLEHMTRCEWKE